MIVPVIISGGAGSRLWPLSREQHPKPFIKLPDGETLIRKTFARAAGLPGVERLLTVTNRELLFLAADEFALVDAPGVKLDFILEPVGRDTAAAVALAALSVAETIGRDAVMLVMPADHLIADVAGFSASVKSAAAMAAKGRIVTFGIRPDRPETGFGYLEVEGDRVLRFVEKPDLARAEAYLAGGRHFWNSGMFCFAAGTMLDAMEAHCPDVLAATRTALEAAQTMSGADRTTVELDRDSFSQVPAISIDYAVMEKAADIGFVPAAFDWSDIGSWTAISDLVEADDAGNRVFGQALLHDTGGSYVHSEDRLVSLVGVSDLLVVDTADALLVAHRDRAQDVKAIYNRLKASGSDEASLHRKVHRPWGTYTVLETGPRFKIKRIVVKPGARLSLQSHRHRSEHWVVVAGTAGIVNGDAALVLSTDQSTYIPCGNRHRLENPGTDDLVIIEVQTGEYLGEDDIVRYDDIYGR